MSEPRAARRKWLRKRILILLQDNQQAGFDSVPDHLFIASTLGRRGVPIGTDEVLALLREMGSRGYVTFREELDRKSGDQWLRDIKITHTGVDLLENTITDAAVPIE